MDTTEQADLQLIIADEPRNTQNGSYTAASRGDTKNANSPQRELKTPNNFSRSWALHRSQEKFCWQEDYKLFPVVFW